jgi:hypothetical protein
LISGLVVFTTLWQFMQTAVEGIPAWRDFSTSEWQY